MYIENHTWYYPEYSSSYTLSTIIRSVSNTDLSFHPIKFDDYTLYQTKNEEYFIINVAWYAKQWRKIWFELLHSIDEYTRNKSYFKKDKRNPTILQVILFNTETLSQKDWCIFLTNPINRIVRIHSFTRSLVAVDSTYLSRTKLYRIPATNQDITWKETLWKQSSYRIRELIKDDFHSVWNRVCILLHEWILFDIDFESAIFDVYKILHDKPLSVQCESMHQLLSLLSIYSTNQCRESIKPSIHSTTRQHTYYILENCILCITKAYHNIT